MPDLQITSDEILNQLITDKPECVQMAVLKVENRKLALALAEATDTEE